MKIKVKESSYTVKPKQREGKVLVQYKDFTTKPKPSGIILQDKNYKYVLKTDEMSGTVLTKKNYTKIVKQND